MSSFLQFRLFREDNATPALNAMMNRLEDKSDLHKLIGIEVAEGTRRHIREAAKTRHLTAERLKSRPTGYLSRAAETVEATSDSAGVRLVVAGAIFQRVSGPVTVRATNKKYLTIPIHAEAVGKRASEHRWPNPAPKNKAGRRTRKPTIGLVMIKSKKGNLLLVKPNGDGTITPFYALKTQIVLPQDVGLLPDRDQMGRMAEKAAAWFLDQAFRQLG